MNEVFGAVQLGLYNVVVVFVVVSRQHEPHEPHACGLSSQWLLEAQSVAHDHHQFTITKSIKAKQAVVRTCLTSLLYTLCCLR